MFFQMRVLDMGDGPVRNPENSSRFYPIFIFATHNNGWTISKTVFKKSDGSGNL